jgi:hypothetical protein
MDIIHQMRKRCIKVYLSRIPKYVVRNMVPMTDLTQFMEPTATFSVLIYRPVSAETANLFRKKYYVYQIGCSFRF